MADSWDGSFHHQLGTYTFWTLHLCSYQCSPQVPARLPMQHPSKSSRLLQAWHILLIASAFPSFLLIMMTVSSLTKAHCFLLKKASSLPSGFAQADDDIHPTAGNTGKYFSPALVESRSSWWSNFLLTSENYQPPLEHSRHIWCPVLTLKGLCMHS